MIWKPLKSLVGCQGLNLGPAD